MSIQSFENTLFLLNTNNTSYVIAIQDAKYPTCIYWGRRIESISDFIDLVPETSYSNNTNLQQLREECSSFGELRVKETSLKLLFADGVRDFRYTCDTVVEDNLLKIILKDINYPVQVTLYYKIYEDADIIEKWRTITNTGDDVIKVERFYSAEYSLPETGYESINYNGHWGAEFQLHSEAVSCGKKVYESLYGLTGHSASPFFALHNQATEDNGEVFFGVLKYSGNFKTVVEATSYDYTNVLIGISDTDFEWNLQPKETFTTPSACSGYTNQGFTGMSNLLSAFARNHVMPRTLANKPLPVLYNSWYSTLFDVRCEDQIALARKAAELGVELFVVDDGWFAGRTDDTAGLGDWYVDEVKFPEGLAPLIQQVNELGMKFGLWIEPEMTNPNSELYRKHPDWIYLYKTREIKMGRNQYMLDLTNPEVILYLIECFDKLLSENNIEYIKWDMNRYISETASASLPISEYKSISFRNTLGVYQIIQALRAKHPEVEFEACASGGGRVDYGSMQYFDEYWPSDNTDPIDRLYMQESYSYLYPIKYMRAWLTDDCLDKREVPLEFFMHSAMCGVLGIGTNINETEPEKLDQIKEFIRAYKEVRNTIQMGRVYRLRSLHKGYLHAVQYTAEQQSVVFIFLLHEMYGKTMHTVKPKGLEADALYRYEVDGCSHTKSGAYLMGMGLSIKLTGDYASKMLVFEKTE